MGQEVLLSLLGGAVSGVLSFVAAMAAARWIAHRRSRGVDLDLYYANMSALKRDLAAETDADMPGSRTFLRLLLIKGVVPAVVMTFALLLISSNARDLAAPPDFSAALPLLLLVWAAVTFAPLAVANLRRARRIAVLEIASILELVARSESDPGELWAISGVKKVLGGDLFGAEEEDHLDLRIERTEVAPIRLRFSGRVIVAEAGVGRSVSKTGLRELRLSGWFVNELSETEVELSREWGLSDTTYADIADALAGVVERLGFSLSGIRLSQVDAGAVPTGGISELILEPLEAETRSS